jgi:hemoglobin
MTKLSLLTRAATAALTTLGTLATLAMFAPLATRAAEASAAAPAGASAPMDDSLFQALGARPGLTALVNDFMARLIADPRTNPFFKDVDQKDLKAKLVTQFCEVSGGPCVLKNHDMKKKHEEQKIHMGDFNAVVEVLQQSMDAQGIAFRTQNKLLATLAPMHRDIVNVH